VIADLGMLHAGITPVSLYTTLAPDQVAYIANHSEATVAVVEDEGFLDVLDSLVGQLPHLRHVILITGEGSASSWPVTGWDDVVRAGRDRHAKNPGHFEELVGQVHPEDLVTLIYTSGTTGPPKAVMIDHRNVMWTIDSSQRVAPLPDEAQMVCYLPMAHVAERFVSHWQGAVLGNTTYFCPELAQLAPVLAAARPNFFFGPPRVWEKLYAGLHAAIARVEDAAQRRELEAAIAAGRRGGNAFSSEPLLHELLSRVGLDQCEQALTGAAPIAPETIEFFRAIGLPLTEIWGMSELTGPGTWFLPKDFRIGTVGVAMPGVEMQIADDGELLVRGGLVMRGYYRDPERTADAMGPDGWLRTGDIAAIDPDGSLRIVDRKKELIITAGGKNISPANLESLLKQHPLIGQACAIGDRRAYLTALIVLDPETGTAWGNARGIDGKMGPLADHPELVAEIQLAVEDANRHVSRVEQIKRFTILPVEWTPDSGELTPTMKMKRRVVHDTYGTAIEAMYTAPRGGHAVRAGAEAHTALT
jgi:long-chain acyl-CoA synthetase